MAGISDASTSRELEEKPSPRGDLAPLPRGPVPARERKAAPARGSSTTNETLFAPAWGASTTVEIFFAHAHSKWLIFDHFHRAGAIFLSQRHPERPPGAMQGRSFFHAAPSGPQREPAALPGCGARGWRGLAGLRGDAPSEARGADGSRAGRRPPAHTAAGPSGALHTSGSWRADRCVVLKPGQVPLPSTGAASGPSGTLQSDGALQFRMQFPGLYFRSCNRIVDILRNLSVR